MRTLSLWECDLKYPAWLYQKRIADYLGFDPFTNPEPGRPMGNEPLGVAILELKSSSKIGDQIRLKRLQMRKNRYQLAQELGISVKTLWNWENGRRKPSPNLLKIIGKFLGV